MSRKYADGDDLTANRLLATLPEDALAFLKPSLRVGALAHGKVLFEPGDDVATTYFPCRATMASLLIVLGDGQAIEAATIGYEGAIGGVISSGHKPAFGRAVVQIPGAACFIATDRLEEAKQRSPRVADIFSRYSDLLTAQLMQSVACNAAHDLQARCCRWLLSAHDRAGANTVHLTHETLAEMLGVQRTSVSLIARRLSQAGMIRYGRGKVEILDRRALEAGSCECYGAVEAHFKAVLPEVAAKT